MGYTPAFVDVRKVGATTSMYPPGVTTDNLVIYPNAVDTYPNILFDGASNLVLLLPNATALILKNTTTNALSMLYGATVYTIESLVNNADLYLKTTGSGVLRFGTVTGTGDVVCNGYLSIKDAAGNAVKLMTTA